MNNNYSKLNRDKGKTTRKFNSSNNNDISSQKMELLNKFIKNTTNTTNEPKTNIPTNDIVKMKNNTIDDNKVYKLEEDIKHLKKLLKIEKEKRKDLSNYKNKCDIKLKKSLKTITELEEQIDKLNNEKSDSEKKLDILKIEYEKAYKLEAENVQLKEELNFYKENIKVVIDENNCLENKCNQLSDNCKELKNIRDKYQEACNKIDYYKDYHDKVVSRSKLIDIVEKHIDDYESSKINLIDSFKLWINGIKSYIHFKLLRDISRRKALINNINQNERKFVVKTYNINGFLRVDSKSNIKFQTLNGVTYEVKMFSVENKMIFDGVLALCDITTTDLAVVKYTYIKEDHYKEYLFKNKIKRAKKKVNNENNINKKHEDIGLKVLIITAVNNSKYTNGLRELGVSVDYFNSYYENAKRLDSILCKYDMVFYCTKSSRHYCKDVIKSQSDYKDDKCKYNTLHRDSLNTILHLIQKKIGMNLGEENSNNKELI